MEAPDTVASASPDSTHIRAEGNANVNNFRLQLPRSAWELVVAVILALSIVMNIVCYYKMRDIDTRKWLHDYDLNQFQIGEFRQLQRQVDLDHALLQQQCKR